MHFVWRIGEQFAALTLNIRQLANLFLEMLSIHCSYTHTAAGLAREMTSEENIPRLRESLLEAFDHPGLEDEVQQAQQKLASLHTTSLAQATTIEQLHVAVSESNTSAACALSVHHTNMYATEEQEARQRLAGDPAYQAFVHTFQCLLSAVLNQAWLTKASDRTAVDNYSVKSIQDHIGSLQTCLESVIMSIEIGFGGFDTEFQLANTVLKKLHVLEALAQVAMSLKTTIHWFGMVTLFWYRC